MEVSLFLATMINITNMVLEEDHLSPRLVLTMLMVSQSQNLSSGLIQRHMIQTLLVRRMRMRMIQTLEVPELFELSIIPIIIMKVKVLTSSSSSLLLAMLQWPSLIPQVKKFGSPIRSKTQRSMISSLRTFQCPFGIPGA